MNTHDPQDYDGMGNFGRFPPEAEPKPHAGNSTRVTMMIISFMMLVFLFLLTG